MTPDLCVICGLITELEQGPPAGDTSTDEEGLARALMVAYELGRQGFELCAMHCHFRPSLKVARELVRAKSKTLHSVPNEKPSR